MIAEAMPELQKRLWGMVYQSHRKIMMSTTGMVNFL